MKRSESRLTASVELLPPWLSQPFSSGVQLAMKALWMARLGVFVKEKALVTWNTRAVVINTPNHTCVSFSINLSQPVSLLKNSLQSFPEAALNFDLALYFPPHRTCGGKYWTSHNLVCFPIIIPIQNVAAASG